MALSHHGNNTLMWSWLAWNCYWHQWRVTSVPNYTKLKQDGSVTTADGRGYRDWMRQKKRVENRKKARGIGTDWSPQLGLGAAPQIKRWGEETSRKWKRTAASLSDRLMTVKAVRCARQPASAASSSAQNPADLLMSRSGSHTHAHSHRSVVQGALCHRSASSWPQLLPGKNRRPMGPGAPRRAGCLWRRLTCSGERDADGRCYTGDDSDV